VDEDDRFSARDVESILPFAFGKQIQITYAFLPFYE
jgi:hypothetical protein